MVGILALFSESDHLAQLADNNSIVADFFPNQTKF